jgi:hypothetical protein
VPKDKFAAAAEQQALSRAGIKVTLEGYLSVTEALASGAKPCDRPGLQWAVAAATIPEVSRGSADQTDQGASGVRLIGGPTGS